MLLDDAHATTEIGHMNDSSEHPAYRPFPQKILLTETFKHWNFH